MGPDTVRQLQVIFGELARRRERRREVWVFPPGLERSLWGTLSETCAPNAPESPPFDPSKEDLSAPR